MKKGFFSIFLALCICVSVTAQHKKQSIKLNQLIDDLEIKRCEEHFFKIKLTADTYYAINVQQQGIDLVVSITNKKGKLVAEVDSPNGKNGPEKILFSPDKTDEFEVGIKPLDEKSNSESGKYTIRLEKVPNTLEKIPVKNLLSDFDLLQNAYYETRVGLWYNSRTQFDSICNLQKSKIKAPMNALEFYRILAPVVSFTKEGHCNIKISDETTAFLKQKGTYLPFGIKVLDKKVYVINDYKDFKLKGLVLSKINGEAIENIMAKMLEIEPADGFNMTSKYRWIEGAFSKYYARYFPASKFITLELLNPDNNAKIVYENIPSCTFKEFAKLYEEIKKQVPNYTFSKSSDFSIDPITSTAVITVNTFSLGSYTDKRKGFQLFLEKAFDSISSQKIKHLIIDIRKNEGGEQGMEDHFLSYLTNEEYKKYKYVEIPGFTYSFLEHTNYAGQKEILIEELKEDFYLSTDGRYLNKAGHYTGEKPNIKNFKGDLYILISGLTFSGGSEFAALAKNYTHAKFIGEETGGGYYGNSSGSFLSFTLPNSAVTGRIPLCKFVIEPKADTIPFGRGVLPDYEVQPTIKDYLAGYDSEMEYVKTLIRKK
ncbi:S41 family peptidase [Flavobacterium sp. KACC 22758]|uniref:S41 family peptidase n=1 Tax=Flavobacterium sp. KACC 22758 TaxID=3025667 RepID=UPI0023657722|nr:S41 family peptidase [Flavobacterium sp. KACC 22758]WDF57597.1 S41 family peptidase [Flavobacterium sp. KACC 22758]